MGASERSGTVIARDLVTGKGGRRIAQGLLRLRSALSASIPAKTLGDCLLVASWNIRDFGKGKHGGRSDEALAYIAEILSRFDLVAVPSSCGSIRAAASSSSASTTEA